LAGGGSAGCACDLQCQNVCLLIKFVHKLLRGDDATRRELVVGARHVDTGISKPPSPSAHPVYLPGAPSSASSSCAEASPMCVLATGPQRRFRSTTDTPLPPVRACPSSALSLHQHLSSPSPMPSVAQPALPLQPRLTSTAQSQLDALPLSLQRHGCLPSPRPFCNHDGDMIHLFFRSSRTCQAFARRSLLPCWE
jgi:hypothetical protein